MKIIVILVIAAILISLFTALRGLLKPGAASEKTVRALTLRVGLSISLFLLLMAGYYFGLIPRSGL